MKRLQCPYHYWTYDLDGRLLSAPHFSGYGQHLVPDGDSADRGLLPVRTAQWHDWIFINIDGKAEPLEDFVAPMAAISWLQQAWYTTSGRTLTPAEVEAWEVLEERVFEEDVGIMDSVQQGVESVAVDDGGSLSPAWETSIAAFYRNLVAELQSRN